jgi:hypothetical protein
MALMGICLFAAAAVQAAPGQVQVTVTIESDKFKRGLKDKLAPAEKELSSTLAKHLRDRFPLIDWLPEEPPAPAAARFSATLSQDALPVPNIRIVFAGRIGASAIAMPQVDPITLYQFKALERPYADPEQLIRDVDSALETWVRTDIVEDNLHDQFVTLVPLANSLEVDAERRAVVIPLAWQRAKLGEESVFRLEFIPDEATGNVAIKLGGVTERRRDPLNGGTQCRPASCTQDGAEVASDALWNTCLQILRSATRPPLLVRVEKYRFNANPGAVSSGLAVSP